MKKWLFAVVIGIATGALSACGGGGGSDNSAGPSEPVSPPPQNATITINQEVTQCPVFQECLAFSAETSSNATDITLQLSDVDAATVEVAGQRIDVGADGKVSFSASSSFKLFVTHSTNETLSFGVSDFTVGGETYTNNTTVEVEFTVPTANVTLDVPSLECGDASCTGTLYSDIPIDGANFTLDSNVLLKVAGDEQVYSADNSAVSFPATTEIAFEFSADVARSVQQVAFVTENMLDSVSIAGQLQAVNESLVLSFDRAVNLTASVQIISYYSSHPITTDASHEELVVKDGILEYGPEMSPPTPRVLVDSLHYELEVWNTENNAFESLESGTINDASGLTIEQSNLLAFNVGTIPWVYRLQVEATIDMDGHSVTLSGSQVSTVREAGESLAVFLFPENVSADVVSALHEHYDSLEEQAEFSSTLASLYPRQYKDEFGNTNTVNCVYNNELVSMFPTVAGTAEVDLRTYCNANNAFDYAMVGLTDQDTQTSMILNISSSQHDDLVEQDFTMPREGISVPYEAQKGSNIVKWRFHSFAAPGDVVMDYVFTAPNTAGAGSLVKFEVRNN